MANLISNATQKESLFYIASVFIAYGTTQISVDFWKGTVALVIGAGLVYLRYIVKKNGVINK